MKKIKTFGIALLTACILTACGGGGGSANNKNNSSNATPVNPTHPATTFDKYTGGVVIVDSNSQTKFQKLNTSDDFKNFIVVDGQKISLTLDSPSNAFNAKGWTIIEKGDKEIHMCCGSYDYVRFGIIDEGDFNNIYFYYNGIPSQDLPTGKAKYAGHFILIDDPSNEDNYRGQANFNVDFSAKTLSGELTHKDIKPIHISATIKGNGFEGSASFTESQKTKAKVEGKFYGPQAKELGGIFDDYKEWGGAFGAKKQ